MWLLKLYLFTSIISEEYEEHQEPHDPPHTPRLFANRRFHFLFLFFILSTSSTFDATLLNYVFFKLNFKVAVLLWQSNAEFLSPALIESVQRKGFDGLALLGKSVCMRPHTTIF